MQRQSATSRICAASRLRPLATTTGASMSMRNSSAMAYSVGLVMTTAARSTSFSMRRRRAWRCRRRIRILTAGIALGFLELVAQILLAHLEFVLVAPAFKKVVGSRPHQQNQRRFPRQLEHVARVKAIQLLRRCRAGARAGTIQSRASRVMAR